MRSDRITGEDEFLPVASTFQSFAALTTPARESCVLHIILEVEIARENGSLTRRPR